MNLEDIRTHCTEEGKCWLWNGGCDGHGRPQCRHGGKTAYVRRLVRELADGKPVPRHLETACACGRKLCVSPECSVATTPKRRAQMASQRGAFRNVNKAIKCALTKRAKSHISDELVKWIKDAPGTCRDIAHGAGISLSHIKAMRNGTARKDYSNPFAGLM